MGPPGVDFYIQCLGQLLEVPVVVPEKLPCQLNIRKVKLGRTIFFALIFILCHTMLH